MLNVLTFPEELTPDALRSQVRAMQEEAWPPTPPVDVVDLGPVHDPVLRPVSMLLVDRGIVLSALDLLFKDLLHAGQPFFAVGLSTVVTPVSGRGRGHARTLVTHAREAMPELGVDLGLFTCDLALKGFYETCGFESLPGTVVVGGTPEQPFPSDQPGFEKVTLAAFLSPSALQARESFIDSRVLLHSGTIDKLW